MAQRNSPRPRPRHRAPRWGPGLWLAGILMFGVAARLGAAVTLSAEPPRPSALRAQAGDAPPRHRPAASLAPIRAGVVAGSATDEAEQEPAHVRRTFTIAAVGDVLVHMPVTNRARAYGAVTGSGYDFAPMFDQIRPALDGADLSICHLEVPLSPDNAGLSGYPRFSAPRQLADGLAAAGFDTCSSASNHAVDRGGQGVSSTLDALDEAGVAHAGTARSAEEAGRPRLYALAGVTVGHVAATYGLNGLPLPPGEPWRVELLDVAHLRARAASARDAGAEFVVASLHWGQEYR